MRTRSWSEQQAIARWYAERLTGGRSSWKQTQVAAAMSGADEVDQNLTRMYVDRCQPLRLRRRLSMYDPAGLIES